MEYFKVSAEWMKACGYGDAAKVYPIKRIEYFGGVNPAFATMYTVDMDGRDWTVAACRGSKVD